MIDAMRLVFIALADPSTCMNPLIGLCRRNAFSVVYTENGENKYILCHGRRLNPREKSALY